MGKSNQKPDHVRMYRRESVLEAARERISFIFDEFDVVIVNHSGGKDSTVIFHLALEEAKRRGQEKLLVQWLDQELETRNTVEHMEEVLTREDVDPRWFQIPFHLFNASSSDEHWAIPWEEGKQWMREKHPLARHVNNFGELRFKRLFGAMIKKDYPGEKVAVLTGVRAQESPARNATIVSHVGYKWTTWSTGKGPDYVFHPIYDWRINDVWIAILEHDWPYNRQYDLMYAHGVDVKAMRVSSFCHVQSLRAMEWLQEVEPDTYEKAVHRIAGMHAAGKDMSLWYPHNLPTAFVNWKEYRDYLLEHIVDDVKWRKKMKNTFAIHDRKFSETPELLESVWKAHVDTVVTCDRDYSKLSNKMLNLGHRWLDAKAVRKTG